MINFQIVNNTGTVIENGGVKYDRRLLLPLLAFAKASARKPRDRNDQHVSKIVINQHLAPSNQHQAPGNYDQELLQNRSQEYQKEFHIFNSEH
jgi:hypothetical protein